jgi:hypothetical protein
MASTPQAAVQEHLAAINARDHERYVSSVAFPFLHTEPDGEKLWYASRAEMPDVSRRPFKRTEIRASEIVATSGELTIYSLVFQRYDDADEPLLRVQGLWAVHRREGEWLVGWRQYLGPVELR